MLVREGAIYVVSRTVPGVLAFATSMLLTWLLPAHEFGLYGFGIAVAVLGNNALFEWFGHGLIRWYESHQDNPVFMPTVLALFAASCLVSLLLPILAATFGLLEGDQTLPWVLLFGIWAYGWFEFTSRIQTCRFQPMRYLFMSITRNGLILAGGILAAFLMGSGEAVLLVAFGAMLFSGSLYMREWARPMRLTFDPVLARQLLEYGAPMFLAMVFSGLMTSIQPVLLGTLASKAAVGGFTISFTLVQMTVLTITQGISMATWPRSVRAIESGDAAASDHQLRSTFTLLLGAVLPASAGLALLAPELGQIFVNPEYQDAIVRTSPWLSACAVLVALRSSYLDAAFQLGRRTALLAQVTGVGAAVNLGLAVALIPRWGDLGAAMAMTIAFAVSTVHAVILVRRHCPLPFPRRETACITFATLVMAVAVVSLAGRGSFHLPLQIMAGVLTYAAVLGAFFWYAISQGLVSRDALARAWGRAP
ncbi:MAG TPA: lipopolysaccharide biosynthesis protein [Roseomonas sp.]|nr:lipopolysaccharide biosynthesis protein [Roseomonas sp.]